jgi:hypothetical protein
VFLAADGAATVQDSCGRFNVALTGKVSSGACEIVDLVDLVSREILGKASAHRFSTLSETTQGCPPRLRDGPPLRTFRNNN